jgi:hypothetical protein
MSIWRYVHLAFVIVACGPDIGLCGAAAAEDDKRKTKIRNETGIV